MNNTKLSTFYEGNGSARPEDLYSAPGYTESPNKKDDDGSVSKKALSSMTNITHVNKRKQIEKYSNVDKDFLSKKPKNPYQYIDKKTQKIESNPGVPYISTS